MSRSHGHATLIPRRLYYGRCTNCKQDSALCANVIARKPFTHRAVWCSQCRVGFVSDWRVPDEEKQKHRMSAIRGEAAK